MLRSSATVHRREKLTRPLKLLAVGLQEILFTPRCTTTWSKQYLSAVHPMTCSLLWVSCLFDGFSISDFGGKWPLKWKFSKMSMDSATGHRTVFRDHIWWKSAVAKLMKGPLDYHAKKLVPAPIVPKMGGSRPKFPERCYPFTCPRIMNLVRIGCALPDLFQKDWFFGPKSKWKL